MTAAPTRWVRLGSKFIEGSRCGWLGVWTICVEGNAVGPFLQPVGVLLHFAAKEPAEQINHLSTFDCSAILISCSESMMGFMASCNLS